MHPWRLLSVIVALGIAFGLSISRMKGPEPQPATSPGFSAIRAQAILAGLLREGLPHPVESPLNKVVRDRILARFAALGYQTTVQAAYSCNRKNTRCANVENIFATPPGSSGELVILAAHYDSVPRGPGASDDGAGVAALLDIAQLVRAEKRIGFLVTDGEEKGLLGAEAFARDPALLARMHTVINVENRGTSGPSLLFETSRRNNNLIVTASRVLERPITASLFPAIYELLPNDTDLTVFKRAGKEGVNLAAIDGVKYYHTAQDDLAHVDLRTLQHHGDNALALARGYAAQFPERANQNRVFFDVFGFFIVGWPERWTVFLLLLSGAAAVSAAVAARNARRSVVLGFATFFLTIIVGAIPGLFLRGVPLMWIAGFAAALLLMRGSFVGVALAWHVVAFAVAFALPGAAYLFAFPAFVMAVGCWLPPAVRGAIASVAAATVCFPLALMLYVALGRTGLAPTAVVVALVGTTFATDLFSRGSSSSREQTSPAAH
jgi:hypothetical protein